MGLLNVSSVLLLFLCLLLSHLGRSSLAVVKGLAAQPSCYAFYCVTVSYQRTPLNIIKNEVNKCSREVICGPYFEVISALLSLRNLKSNLVLIITWEMRSSVVHVNHDS